MVRVAHQASPRAPCGTRRSVRPPAWAVMVMSRSAVGKTPAPRSGHSDQTECAAVEIVADAEELQFLRIGEPVQVEMVGAQLADFVRLDQGKGRAFHRAGMAEAAQDAAREGGLAGAEVAMQVDHPCPRWPGRCARPVRASRLPLRRTGSLQTRTALLEQLTNGRYEIGRRQPTTLGAEPLTGGGMQPDRQAGRLERLHVLGQQGTGDARQHVTHAGTSHRRMPLGTDGKSSVRRGDQAAGALQHHHRLVATRQFQRRRRAIRLHLGGRGDPTGARPRRDAASESMSAALLRPVPGPAGSTRRHPRPAATVATGQRSAGYAPRRAGQDRDRAPARWRVRQGPAVGSPTPRHGP